MEKSNQKGFTPLERPGLIRRVLFGGLITSKKDSLTGFTIIEAIATTFIFSILLLIISSAFILFLNAQRRAFNLQQSIQNTSYILEAMAKEIRMASSITTATSCPSSNTSLSFIDSTGSPVAYSLEPSSGNVIRNTKFINSNTVMFSRLDFCAMGTAPGDNIQPRIMITAGVKSRGSSQRTSLNVQTTISTRNLDVD